MTEFDSDYLCLVSRIINTGKWVHNERTGKRCKTIINADLKYNVADKIFPILTTKQTFWKGAIAEIQGYLLGLTNAKDFRELGTKTWDANANKTKAWLNNPNRKGLDDCGKIYGAVAKDFNGLDLIQKVYNNLKNGIDDRGEIITFWNPADFDKGCLRPCMYQHHFSILDGELHLHSTQRSIDVALGLPYNAIQCYFLLELMAQITGLKAGFVYHKLVNVHIYEDQLDLLKEQLTRSGVSCYPEFTIPSYITSLEDLEKYKLSDVCVLENYKHEGRINFPFSE